MQATQDFNVNSPAGQKLNIKDLDDTALAQLFVDHHCAQDGDKDVAREALGELISRDLQRTAAKSLAISEALVTGQNGGYFRALADLAKRMVR